MKKTEKKAKSKISVNKKSKFVLNKEIWPQERDLLFRPDRLKYVRRLIQQEGCVFCSARDKGLNSNSLCLFKTDHSMVVLNKFPYNPGHLLILPQKHCGDILTLSEIEYSDLNLLVREAMAALTNTYKPTGINLGLNHGAVSGAGIPEHLHYHLIPRWAGDTNFFPLIAETKVIVENLEQTYSRLNEYFKGLK